MPRPLATIVVVLQLNLRGTPDEIVDGTCHYSFELLAEHLADSCH